MNPLPISEKNGNLEIVAKITDSIVKEYGCRVKFDKERGQIDLIGDDYCKEIVSHVIQELMES